MGSREIFNYELQVTNPDWNNFDHRRSVAASLVQGVYEQEHNRQQGRQAEDLPWWNFFHFQVVQRLTDDDHSIFGAIYKFKYSYQSADSAPNYVIAFRGTLLKLGDLKLDLKILRHQLHQSRPFDLAMQTAQNMVTSHEGANIWLAGHSLGSAMALLVGKNMAKMGYCIETYLFNPPFVSVPIEKIKSQLLKDAIRITTSFAKAGLAVAIKGHGQRPSQDDPFAVLSTWVPNLFVNRSDHICSEYIGYFEHRPKMEKIRAGKVEKLATQNSVRSLLSGNSEPLHLLPSARLTINPSTSPGFRVAHGICQWLDPNSHYGSVEHRFM